MKHGTPVSTTNNIRKATAIHFRSLMISLSLLKDFLFINWSYWFRTVQLNTQCGYVCLCLSCHIFFSDSFLSILECNNQPKQNCSKNRQILESRKPFDKQVRFHKGVVQHILRQFFVFGSEWKGLDSISPVCSYNRMGNTPKLTNKK